MRTVIENIILYFILVLIQALVFNHICVFNVATPVAFIYLILLLPFSLNVSWVMTVAFFLGLSVDIFSDTQGMNALACVLLAVARRPIFGIYVSHEEENEKISPTMRSIGGPNYTKYALTTTLFYCTCLCFIQAFSFASWELILWRIVGCTIITTMSVLAIDALLNLIREK